MSNTAAAFYARSISTLGTNGEQTGMRASSQAPLLGLKVLAQARGGEGGGRQEVGRFCVNQKSMTTSGIIVRRREREGAHATGRSGLRNRCCLIYAYTIRIECVMCERQKGAEDAGLRLRERDCAPMCLKTTFSENELIPPSTPRASTIVLCDVWAAGWAVRIVLSHTPHNIIVRRERLALVVKHSSGTHILIYIYICTYE